MLLGAGTALLQWESNCLGRVLHRRGCKSQGQHCTALHCSGWRGQEQLQGGCLQRVLLLQRQEAGGQLRGGCLWLVLHCWGAARRAEGS